MKFDELIEQETKQLNEISRSGAFKTVGAIAGLLGGATTYALTAGAAGIVTASLPLAIIVGTIYGAYAGAMATVFVKGKQRTLYDKMLSLVKKRDDILGKVKNSEANEKQLKRIHNLSTKIKKIAEQLDKLIDFGKGGAGMFRRELSPKEKEQLQNVIKAGKGETKDLLSFKFNIDPKKIK